MALQDSLKDIAGAAARGVGRAARVAHDAVTSPEGQRVVAEAKKAGKAAADAVGSAVEKAAPVVRDAAKKAAPVVEDAARKVGPALRRATEKAAPVVEDVAGKVGRAAHDAADWARGTKGRLSGEGGASRTGDAASDRGDDPDAASTRRSSGRPQASVDDATGQAVQSEVYVINEDGTRDYDVFPKEDPTRSMGPLARRVAGLILVLAGIPMLVLPGPGLAAIAAGLALMGGKPASSSKRRSDPDPS